METILNNIFIGFDQKEAIAYHTFVQSLIENSSIPLSITPLSENKREVGSFEGCYEEMGGRRRRK